MIFLIPTRPNAPNEDIQTISTENSITITNTEDYLNCEYSKDGTYWREEALLQVQEVKGYGKGTYGLNDTITREQLVTILYRYSAESKFSSISPDYEGLKKFSDENEISEYARPAMAWACARGIINGKDYSMLDPKGFATRAEVAKTILNYMNL